MQQQKESTPYSLQIHSLSYERIKGEGEKTKLNLQVDPKNIN